MSRKKLIITAVILTLILIIGGILAYFTDVDTKTNSFKMGNVSIKVVEENWEGGETGVVDIVPNQIVNKDPKIENTGSTDVYVFIKVKVPYANVVVGDVEAAAETELFTYDLNAGWVEVGTSTKDEQDKTITHVYAYVDSTNTSVLKALEATEKTPTVFDTVKLVDIKETDDGNSTIQGADLEVEVSGYGIQTTDLGTDSKAPAVIWPLVESAN